MTAGTVISGTVISGSTLVPPGLGASADAPPRSWSLVATVALAAAIGVASGTTPARASSATVSSEFEFRVALLSFGEDDTGPHTVTLGADITLDGAGDPIYVGTQPLTIDGNGHALDGGGNSRIVTGSGPLLRLEDITVRNGSAAGSGGAVEWTGAIEVVDAVVTDNDVVGTGLVTGGAIRVTGDLEVVDSQVTNNSATSTTGNASGGAVYINGGNTFTAERSVLSGNTVDAAATAAGGVVVTTGDLHVTDSVVTGNRATGPSALGGALRPAGASTVTRSWLTGNELTATTSVADGAAIGAGTGSVTVVDSTLTDNTVTGVSAARGGAVGVPVTTLRDSTVWGNQASGGGLRVGGVYAFTSLTLEHATIVGNAGSNARNVHTPLLTADASVFGAGTTGPSCVATTSVTSNSVDDDGTCVDPGDGNVVDVDDLGLRVPRDNGGQAIPAVGGEFDLLTVFPLAGSPAIDLVPAAACLDAVDQRGEPRPFGADCDAGAIEAAYPAHAFTDVGPWVEDAVRWLASDVNDPALMVGITPTTFRTGDPITRAQVARLLYRVAGEPFAGNYDPHGLSDVPPWVEDAVRWAVGEGIASGFDNGTFRPNDPITRAQVVRMVHRLAGSPVAPTPHPFTDVPPWVAPSVDWAADPSLPLPIFSGLGPTTFRPNDDITRGQVARSVYRLAISPAAWADPDDAPFTVPFQQGVVT